MPQSFVGYVYLSKERNPFVPWARKFVNMIKISIIKN